MLIFFFFLGVTLGGKRPGVSILGGEEEGHNHCDNPASAKLLNLWPNIM